MAEPIDKDTRGPVNLRIKFRSESLQQFIERYGVDVSRGGIFIRTREPLPVGTRLKLDFQLVDTAPLFQGDGTVVWIREHDASRAGVTPGMGVRFDRLSQESQTTLDTILEEKIRLQQSGVAPGSIAKAGAGIAVRRPSGAFATLDGPGAKGPPPLPIEVRMDSSSAPGPAPRPPARCRFRRRAPVRTRRRARAASSAGPAPPAACVRFRLGRRCSSRPRRTTSTRRCRSSRRRAARRPCSRRISPTVINRSDGKPISDDDPTRVFDASAAEEFSANDAVTGKSQVLPETGVPTATEGDGELTQRRSVESGERRCDRGRPVRRDRQGRQARARGDAGCAARRRWSTRARRRPRSPPRRHRASPLRRQRASRPHPEKHPERPFPACRCGSRPTGPPRPRAAASAATPATSARAARVCTGRSRF